MPVRWTVPICSGCEWSWYADNFYPYYPAVRDTSTRSTSAQPAPVYHPYSSVAHAESSFSGSPAAHIAPAKEVLMTFAPLATSAT